MKESASIRRLELSTRARNILAEEGIATVGELRAWASQANARHLATVSSLGPRTLAEIRFELHAFDQRL